MLHMRCTKLHELATASDEQIMRQADTIRRLEYCVDPDSTANAHLQLVQAQRSIQALQQAVAVRVCVCSASGGCGIVSLHTFSAYLR